jgi:hypothetical protein
MDDRLGVIGVDGLWLTWCSWKRPLSNLVTFDWPLPRLARTRHQPPLFIPFSLGPKSVHARTLTHISHFQPEDGGRIRFQNFYDFVHIHIVQVFKIYIVTCTAVATQRSWETANKQLVLVAPSNVCKYQWPINPFTKPTPICSQVTILLTETSEES